MQKLKVRCDLPTPQHHALLFVAMALEEQLFDLTDDSFKAPALNTYTRTFELQAVAAANHAAGISKDALNPFVDELEWSISRDPVLSAQQKALCRLHIDNIKKNLGEQDRIVRGASGLRMVLGSYFESIVQALRDTVVKTPGHKEDLAALVSSFIAGREQWISKATHLSRHAKRAYKKI